MELKKWLKLTDTSIKTFAAKLQVDQSTVYRYVNGELTPRLGTMDDIAKLTKGDVKRSDW
jgi:transcriptional regulator with XRE-family HTH domain